MLETGFEIRKGQAGACEPGVCDDREAFVRAKSDWIEKKYLELCEKDVRYKDIGKEKKYKAEAFRTKLPNLDVRHGGNFSGMRFGKNKTYILPYWGKFSLLMEAKLYEK